MTERTLDYLKWIRENGFDPDNATAVEEMDYYILGMESAQPTPPAATPDTLTITAEELGEIEEALRGAEHVINETRQPNDGSFSDYCKVRKALSLIAKIRGGV